jgi:hypothetical protein
VILSWDLVPSAVRYHVHRDSWLGPVTQIATVEAPPSEPAVWVDQLANLVLPRHYQVVAEDAAGRLSGPSNVARTPLLGPQVTFDVVAAWLERARPARWAGALLGMAQRAASDGAYADSRAILVRLRRDLTGALPLGTAEDGDVLISKLTRRVQLVEAGLVPPDLLFGQSAP